MATRRRSSSLQGLQSAMAPNPDPLGLDAQKRGMDAYIQEHQQFEPGFKHLGPLPDPKWVGYFQTLADQGVRGLSQDVERPHGTIGQPVEGDVGALQYAGDTIDGGPLMQSTHLGTRGSLTGLRRARRR